MHKATDETVKCIIDTQITLIIETNALLEY